MRSYNTRTAGAGGYLASLLLLTLLYLALMLPAAAAVVTTLVALAPTGEGGPSFIAGFLGLVAAGSYPLVALVALVGGWLRYAERRYPQALSFALLPMINLALFGLAVGLAQLLGK